MSKQIVAAFVLFLGASAATTARAATAQANCALPAIAATAALQEIPASNLMTVPVKINGKPKQFLLDIGTTTTEISQAAVKELGLTQPAKRSAYGSGATAQTFGPESSAGGGGTSQFAVVDVRDAQAREESRPLVGVESFTIGQVTGHNLVFAVAGSREMGTATPMTGS